MTTNLSGNRQNGYRFFYGTDVQIGDKRKISERIL